MARRIGVMAAGRIGRAAVDMLVHSYPDSLHALVTTEPSFREVLLPDHCRRFSWGNVSEGSAETLVRCHLDILILAWWPHLLKGPLLEVAPTILNTHPSLLPHGRGKDSEFLGDCGRIAVRRHDPPCRRYDRWGRHRFSAGNPGHVGGHRCHALREGFGCDARTASALVAGDCGGTNSSNPSRQRARTAP